MGGKTRRSSNSSRGCCYWRKRNCCLFVYTQISRQTEAAVQQPEALRMQINITQEQLALQKEQADLLESNIILANTALVLESYSAEVIFEQQTARPTENGFVIPVLVKNRSKLPVFVPTYSIYGTFDCAVRDYSKGSEEKLAKSDEFSHTLINSNGWVVSAQDKRILEFSVDLRDDKLRWSQISTSTARHLLTVDVFSYLDGIRRSKKTAAALEGFFDESERAFTVNGESATMPPTARRSQLRLMFKFSDDLQQLSLMPSETSC